MSNSNLSLDPLLQSALQHHHAGQLPEAEAAYREILRRDPRHVDALHFLGVLASQVNRHAIAANLIRQAIALKPVFPDAFFSLGCALHGQNALDEAIAAYQQAIALKHNFPEAYNNLGNALRDNGQLGESIAAYRQAIVLKPDFAEAQYNLGGQLKAQDEFDEAIVAYRRAITLKPNFPEAFNNLGNALKHEGQLDEAADAFRQAIVLKPQHAEAHHNLGSTLKDRGQLEEALAALRQAITLKPSFPEAHSNLVNTLYYYPGCEARTIAEELGRWNRQHTEPLKKFIQPHDNERNPERRLRIGYVSADFKNHASAFFLDPLLRNHDRAQVEIFCYAEVGRPDPLTERFRSLCQGWRNTVGLSDEALAEQIRNDGIDILVDLKLHTAGNRLLVFARKPAPVQVTWLGYPGSTGLTTIDHRLSDPYLDPLRADESVYSEQTVRLPDSFWCYDPLDGRKIPVNSLPALEKGVVTFGSLNNFSKVNEGVLALWARILEEVEDSRLLLLAPAGSARQRTIDRLSRDGIDSARVEFVSLEWRREYLQNYHRIDIGLDCFPCNGHTTSLDSFWMGVPVVTQVERTTMGRAGWSQLSNLGLPELAGQTPEEFVRIAVALARDLPRLRELRATLRQRMEASPLMDAPRFARNMEAAYRRMWRTWCATGG